MSGLIAGALAALSGAGNSIAKSANEYQQFQDKEAAEKRETADAVMLARERANLQVEASNRIAEANEKRTNAPLDRFSVVAKKYAETGEVPDQPKDAPAKPEAKDAISRATTTPAEFATTYRGAAERAAERLGIDPDVLLAQWGHETGWGKSVIPGTNNLGNIKDMSGAGVAATDNMTGSRDKYRAFESPDQFADHFADLIERKYPGAVGLGKDAAGFGAALAAGGYAEDKQYARKIGAASDTLGRAPKSDVATPGAADQAASSADPSAPPKMRKMTSDEAVAAALSDLKVNDPVAYKAAFDNLKGEHVLVGPNGALVNSVTNKVGYHNDSGEKIAQARIDAADARQDKAIKAKEDQADKQIAAKERMFDMKMKSAADRATPDPKAIESTAHSVANYLEKPLPSRVRGTPFGIAVMDRVRELKPEWDEKQYAAMDKSMKNFWGGKNGDTIRSNGVAIDHIGTAMSLIDALGNKDVNAINALGNRLGAMTGSTAPTNFDAVKHIVADEIVKSVVGGASALADREKMAETIRASNSPDQIRGVFTQFKSLMRGQLDGLRLQYESTTGRDDFDSFMSPAAREAFHGNTPTRPVNQARPATSIANPISGTPANVQSLLDKYK